MINTSGLTRGAVLLLGLASPSMAQSQGTDGIQVGTASFVVARYASVSASSLYAGYSLGPFGVLLAAVHNPRSGYSEIVGGLVTRVAAGRQATHVAVAVADASDGRYVQTYLVPSLSLPGFNLSGTLEWYEPLDARGVRQLDVNPVTLLVPLHRRIGLGVAYTLALAEGDENRQRAGPVLQVVIPSGTLYAEILRSVHNSKDEIRVGLQAAF